MELSQLVTTYEQSKRIQELMEYMPDYDTYFEFVKPRGNDERKLRKAPKDMEADTEECKDHVPTFTAEELGEILPESIEVFKDGKLFQYWLRIQKSSGRREIYYHDEIRDEPLLQYIPEWGYDDSEVNFILGPTLAQAMGDMLIYLLENNLLPDKESNVR